MLLNGASLGPLLDMQETSPTQLEGHWEVVREQHQDLLSHFLLNRLQIPCR